MPRKAFMIGPLVQVLPPYSAKRWLFAFEIAASHPKLRTESIHDLLRRAVVTLKIAARRRDPATGRFQYARARVR